MVTKILPWVPRRRSDRQAVTVLGALPPSSPHQMIGLMVLFSSSVRLWLLPNAVLLVVLSTWGALRYPHLPGRIPKHIGVDGVDAWTDKSIGSAFVLVFVYAGLTVLMAGCGADPATDTAR